MQTRCGGCPQIRNEYKSENWQINAKELPNSVEVKSGSEYDPKLWIFQIQSLNPTLVTAILNR